MLIFQMLWAVVVLCATTALADTGVYEVTGGSYKGLYMELDQPQFFQKLGGPDCEGFFDYLTSKAQDGN